jgi:integrase
LTFTQVNLFLVKLKDSGITGTTISNYKRAIVRIWNAAVDAELCLPFNPRQLRTPRIQRRPVRSWSLSQVVMLSNAAAMTPGVLQCGILIADLLAAWIRFGYDTGLRPSDLRILRWSDLDITAGTATITQHKTHRPHVARFSAEASRRLLRIEDPARELVFPLTKGGMRRLELILYRYAAGLGFRRIKGQGLGTLRKTHATQIYESEGEHAAAESLGHVGGTRTVRTHYIDSRSLRSGRLPPEPKSA